MTDRTDAVMESVCGKLAGVKLIFGLSAAVVGLNLLWVPFVQPGTGTYVVVVMSIGGMSPFLVVSAVLLRTCRRRQERLRNEVQRRRAGKKR